MRSRIILRQIADQHDVTVEAIRGESRQRSLLPIRRKIAVALRADGYTMDAIAEAMGKSRGIIFYYLNEEGAERQKAAARLRLEARAA